jgi:hypothetical protein
MWVRLPLDTFNRFSFTHTHFQSNNMSNNNIPRILPCGSPNIEGNPRVLAAFLDLVGCNLTSFIPPAVSPMSTSDDLADGIYLDAEQAETLLGVIRLVGIMRGSVGINEPWHGENLMIEVTAVRRERDAHERKINAQVIELAKMIGMPIPPDMLAQMPTDPLPTASESADAILDALRNDGVIG